MAAAPKFSIVIPAYCRPDCLSACLESLQHLDYPKVEFEVLVVDDGSEPPLSASAMTLPAGIQVYFLRSPQNEGPAAARNRGAAQAKGDYLAFIDDDCLPRPDWLLNLEKELTNSPESLIGGGIRDGLPWNPYSAASASIFECVYRHYNSNDGSARFLGSGNIGIPAALFRRIGGFHPAFRTSEDREFCGRCIASGIHLAYAPDAVVVHKEPIGFLSFWRRHFGYGQGSYRFWSLGAAAGEAPHGPQVARFYWRLVCSPFEKHKVPRSLLLSGLVVISQTASALGLLSAWFKSKAGRDHIPPARISGSRG
jgi:glycosyltransferase involved in cell wall biosynthesis